MLIYSDTEHFDSHVLLSGVPVLVDFWASWCGPCMMLAPVLEGLADRKDFNIVKIDVDKDAALAEAFGIDSIPALLVFKNGQLVNRGVGLMDEAAVLRLLDLRSTNSSFA